MHLHDFYIATSNKMINLCYMLGKFDYFTTKSLSMYFFAKTCFYKNYTSVDPKYDCCFPWVGTSSSQEIGQYKAFLKDVNMHIFLRYFFSFCPCNLRHF